MLWTPPPSLFHCPTCVVEWSALVRIPCWVCGGESREGQYKSESNQGYPLTTSMHWPSPDLESDRVAF